MSPEASPDRATAIIDALYGSETLNLQVLSWRQFLHGARRLSKEHVDDHRLELRCRLQRGLLATDIVVGENPTENLQDLDFSLEIRSAQRVYADLEAKTGAGIEEDTAGWLIYHPPIPPDDLAGLPNIANESATGSITGHAFFGIDTVREISRLLALQPEQDIHIGITLNATATTAPNSLNYKMEEFGPTTYRWGMGGLKVIEAVVVAKPAVTIPCTPEESYKPEELPSGTIADNIDKLNTNVSRLSIYILVVLGMILIELWFHH